MEEVVPGRVEAGDAAPERRGRAAAGHGEERGGVEGVAELGEVEAAVRDEPRAERRLARDVVQVRDRVDGDDRRRVARERERRREVARRRRDGRGAQQEADVARRGRAARARRAAEVPGLRAGADLRRDRTFKNSTSAIDASNNRPI